MPSSMFVKRKFLRSASHLTSNNEVGMEMPLNFINVSKGTDGKISICACNRHIAIRQSFLDPLYDTENAPDIGESFLVPPKGDFLKLSGKREDARNEYLELLDRGEGGYQIASKYATHTIAPMHNIVDYPSVSSLFENARAEGDYEYGDRKAPNQFVIDSDLICQIGKARNELGLSDKGQLLWNFPPNPDQPILIELAHPEKVEETFLWECILMPMKINQKG